MTTIEKPPAGLPVLPAAAMNHQVNFTRRHFQVSVGNHITLEDIARPAFWVHHQQKVKPGDVIEVLSEDLLLEAHLRVIKSENRLVHTRPFFLFEDKARKAVLAQAKALAAGDESKLPAVPDGYAIGFSPKGGHYVKLRATNSVIATGCANKLIAINKAIEHAKEAGTYAPPAAAA